MKFKCNFLTNNKIYCKTYQEFVYDLKASWLPDFLLNLRVITPGSKTGHLRFCLFLLLRWWAVVFFIWVLLYLYWDVHHLGLAVRLAASLTTRKWSLHLWRRKIHICSHLKLYSFCFSKATKLILKKMISKCTKPKWDLFFQIGKN